MLCTSTRLPGCGRPATPAAAARDVRANGMKDNVAKLAVISGIRRVLVPAANHSIDNVEGKKASVAIYAHLAQQFGGKLNKDAAAEGLALYDEFVEEAQQQPGSHPNIDLLLKVQQEGLEWDLVVEQEQ